jgi:hypothetical protein
VNYGKLLAICVILLSAGAAVGYLIARDYRHAIYWAAGAVLTASVTF